MLWGFRMKKGLKKGHCSVPTGAPKCILSYVLLHKILLLSCPGVNGFKLPEGRFGLGMKKRYSLPFCDSSSLYVVTTVLSALSQSPTGAWVYKCECVLWAMLRIKRRPGKKNCKKQAIAWGKAGLQKHLMLKLWQMSHIAARASCGNMAGVGLIWNNK